MQSDGRWGAGMSAGLRAWLRAFRGLGAPLLGVAWCLAIGGCTGLDQAVGGLGQGRGITVSFESIDGPPPEVFRRFLSELDGEAAAHRIKVVPAGSEAAYRIRGYLAAHSSGAAGSIAWAWDVYDADLHRAFRLGGEETAADARSGSGHQVWALADEALLRRIARSGLEQLADRAASPANLALEPALTSPRRGAAATDVTQVAAAATGR